MKKRVTSGPLLGEILRKIAPKLGATIVMEPKWKIVGQIVFPNGQKRYFRYSTLDLNPVGASDVAKDKDYANFFMSKMGYPTVPGRTFFSNRWSQAIKSPRNIDAAYQYAATIGFPVFVKPNSGSQGVAVSKAHTKREFYRAMREIFVQDRVALVQKPVYGRDYRIVVLGDNVISAYERVPLNVVGDGRSTIRRLLAAKQERFVAISRDTMLRVEDKRIAENLARHKLTMRSVIPRGERVFLLNNANLSSGGDAIDKTEAIHPEFREIAIRLTSDMGLRLCGVDLIIDGDISQTPRRYWVLEVNAAPGLDHYVKIGKAQQRIVEAMYLKILQAMQV